LLLRAPLKTVSCCWILSSTMRSVSCLIVFVSVLSLVCSQGIGDRLLHTAIIYDSLPLNTSDAENGGWSSMGDCDPNFGIPYAQEGSPSHGSPIIIYYTTGGQIAGVAMEHFGDPIESLENYWIPQDDGNYRLSVSFRPSGGLCDDSTYEETIGTQLVINQGTLDVSVPLTSADASNALYTSGSCIGGMGRHWSYDLSTAPIMSWISANLQPIVAMYNLDTGNLSAFFFTTTNVQRSWPLGPWEGPFISYLMCKNWCDSSCSWDASLFSTLHFFITDPSLNNCPSMCN